MSRPVEGIPREVPAGFGGTAAGTGGDAVPPPPYQLRNCTFLMFGTTFDPAVAQAMVPAGLRIAEGASGGFYMYSAPEGWGIAPFTATLAFVDVEGFDAADGSKGRALFGYYSGRAGQTFSRWGSPGVGQSRIELTPERGRGIGGPLDEQQVEVSLRRTGAEKVPVSGAHYYLWSGPDASLRMNSVAYCFDYEPAADGQVRITAPAGSVFARLMPRTVTWAAVLTGAIISIGPPSVQIPAPGAAREADTAAMVHLTLLAQTGRGAVLVGPGGRIRFMNRVAEEMSGDGFLSDGDAFRCRLPDQQSRLLAAIDGAIRGEAAGVACDPLPLTRSTGRRPLLVQPILLADTAAQAWGSSPHPGEGSVLLLLTDPDRGTERDPARALELLGLAPAEARIAALVGGGLAPKEVARRLGNTEGTVRFSLNQVYRKLGVGRQSELARIVSRLETVGI